MQKTPASSKHMLTLIAALVLLPLASILFSSWQELRLWETRYISSYDSWLPWTIAAPCGLALVEH